MKRARRSAQSLIPLLVLLSVVGCGDNDLKRAGVSPTAAPQPPTATATATATGTGTATPTFTPIPSPSATAAPTATPSGATALFSLDPLAPVNPFPSDRLLDPSGRVRVTGEMLDPGLPEVARYDRPRAYLASVAQQLSTLSGFSTYAPIQVRVDRPVSLPPLDAEPPPVIVLERDQPQQLHPVEVSVVEPETAGRYAIEIQPLLPFNQDTSYVYVVTNSVTGPSGEPLSPDPTLVEALADPPPELMEWRASLDPVLARLEDDFGVSLSEIAAIDTFTTQNITADLVAIRRQFDDGMLPVPEPVFEDSPLPGVEIGIFEEGSPAFAALTGTPASETLAAVAVGVFRSFDFRTGRQAAFDPARVSGEVVPDANDLVFYVSIPKAPPPPGGYPLIIAGHGLGGEGRFAIDIAPLFGDVPVMLMGTSAVEHGRRGNVSGFFNLGNVFATRDNFRQTIADFLQMERMARAAEGPPFDLVDKTRIHYFGVSLGGIMGTLYMAVEPDVAVGMLSVPGGGLPRIVDSPSIGDLLNPLIGLTAGISVEDPLFPVFLRGFQSISQWPIDPADPINYAPFVLDPDRRLPDVPPKRILVHEGIVDTVVPNPTTDALARAMGLADLNATGGCVDPENGCSGIWRFVMADYGLDPSSGHAVTFLVPQAFEQAVHFLSSDGTEVIDASPPSQAAARTPR